MSENAGPVSDATLPFYEDDDIQGRMKISRNNLMMKPTSPFMWAWMMTAAKRIYLIRWNSEQHT